MLIPGCSESSIRKRKATLYSTVFAFASPLLLIGCTSVRTTICVLWRTIMRTLRSQYAQIPVLNSYMILLTFAVSFIKIIAEDVLDKSFLCLIYTVKHFDIVGLLLRASDLKQNICLPKTHYLCEVPV